MFGSLVPWRERVPGAITRLENEMESLVDRFFHPEEEWWTPPGRFVPRANLVETESGYEVTVDLPGMKPSEVDVQMKNGDLWISGERKEEKEERGRTFHRIERRYGEFRRRVPLPGNVDEEKVEASFEAGVLRVVIPKTEEAKPKHIEVKST